MALMVLSGFCFKSSGIVYKNKADYPGVKYDPSYETLQGGYEEKKAGQLFLDNIWDYPWGICFPKGKHNFQKKHLNWTRKAMQAWNKVYKKFLDVRDVNDLSFKEIHKYIEFEVIDILLNLDEVEGRYEYDFFSRRFFVDFPNPDKNPLFIWSCDKSKYNLVNPSFGDVPENVLAYHQPIHNNGDFYGEIVMSNREKWKRYHFTNVMIHELGHALGLPHLNPKETEIMASHGFFCEGEGKKHICNITMKDFMAFLQSYPQNIQTRDDIIDDRKIKTWLRKFE